MKKSKIRPVPVASRPPVSGLMEDVPPHDISEEIFQIRFSGYTLRYTSRALLSESGPLPLSPREYRLLQTFVRHPNTPIPRQALFRILCGFPEDASVRGVDASVSRLRKKLKRCLFGNENTKEDLTKRPNPIRQVRGIGYGLWNTV